MGALPTDRTSDFGPQEPRGKLSQEPVRARSSNPARAGARRLVASTEEASALRFTTPDGIGISYRIWGEPGSRPPVLLHHGFAVDAATNWVAPGIVRALTEAGRHVVALDARGHGASDKPHDPAAYGEAKMAQDLIALVDRLGFGSYDLAGYSMGAIVSLIVATQDARLRRLVVGGVGAGVVELGGVDTRALPNHAIAAALEADEPLEIEHEGAAGLRALADSLGADRVALAAHLRVVHAGPIPLERIVVPTLVLAGDADPLAARPEVLAGAIRDAEIVRLSGDHLSAVTNPALAEALVSFLARR